MQSHDVQLKTEMKNAIEYEYKLLATLSVAEGRGGGRENGVESAR